MNQTPKRGVLFSEQAMNAWAGEPRSVTVRGEYSEALVSSEPTSAREFDLRLADSSALAFRVALGVLRNREDAEDVAQEAFLRAFRNFDRLRDREAFRSWLVRITWRLALDRQRSERRRERRELAVALSTAPPSVEELVASREFEQHLDRAVDGLPPKLRIVVVLAAIEQYDTREVAQLLDLPEGTVKSRLFLARSRLAEELRWLVSKTKHG